MPTLIIIGNTQRPYLRQSLLQCCSLFEVSNLPSISNISGNIVMYLNLSKGRKLSRSRIWARLAQLNFTCRAVFLENNSMSNFMSRGESHVFAASPCA
jgi:hypothetical protein